MAFRYYSMETASTEMFTLIAYYDNRYVEKVKRSGFFDQLWR